MSIEELRQTIEQRTGVPASLLNGETAEENIAQAKALLAFKREHAAAQARSSREQFAAWYTAQIGEDPQDTAAAALADLEEAERAEAGGYPRTQDGGEVTGIPDARPAREQFAAWLEQQAAFDPFKQDGWKDLL